MVLFVNLAKGSGALTTDRTGGHFAGDCYRTQAQGDPRMITYRLRKQLAMHRRHFLFVAVIPTE